MQYDFTIVGGGIVGLSFAAALQDANFSIALVSAQRPSAQDGRFFALNEISCQFLKKLQLWDAVASSSAVIDEIHVSHRGHFGSVRLKSENVDYSHLGQVVPARVIESALYDVVSRQPNLTLYCPATVTAISKSQEGVSLTFDTKAEVNCLQSSFVIAADGSYSTIRSLLSVPTESIDYQQTAIVTHTDLTRSHRHVAYERFIEDGAIAMLPLPSMLPEEVDRVATIWTTTTPIANQLLALSDKQFLDHLQHVFGYRLGRLEKVGKRYAYPLHFINTQHLGAERVMLIGNAAHTLHPITALGFNLALFEVVTLADEIMRRSLQHQRIAPADWQQLAVLLQMQEKQRIRIAKYLPSLFNGVIKRYFPFMLSAGMLAFDLLPSVKESFISTMMGQAKLRPGALMSD